MGKETETESESVRENEYIDVIMYILFAIIE